MGREISQHRDYSEETAIRIDEQVKKLVQRGYERARVVLEEHSVAMVQIAETLLEREVLDGAEVRRLIDGLPLAPLATAKPPKDNDSDTQQVIRPEGGRRVPNLADGERPQTA